MDLYLEDEDLATETDMLEIVEHVVSSDDRFLVQRSDDGDVQFAFHGPWAEAVGCFSWRDELPALLFTVSFDLAAPEARRTEVARLIAQINEHLWLGHFDLWADDGAIVFRHALPMIGRCEVAPGEIQALMAAALDAADRFYPAFDLVIAKGMTAEIASEAALFETVGEA
jgi:hypothetical protein